MGVEIRWGTIAAHEFTMFPVLHPTYGQLVPCVSELNGTVSG